MPRKTLFLIIFLAIAAGFFTSLAILEKNHPINNNASSSVSDTRLPTTLTIIKDSLSSISGSTSATNNKIFHQTLDVVLDAPTSIRIIQLELSYDPTNITNVKIIKGNFLPESIELFNTIDQNNGRISYALAIPQSFPIKRGKGIISTISFDFLPYPKQNTTTILFLPKTQIMTDNIQGSILSGTTGVTLQIPSTLILPKFKQASASPSSPFPLH